ncbi:MAG: trehalose-phosphatase, partial [Chloroflexota bacterium]
MIDERLVSRGAAILRARPSALLSDIDGTLSEIAPRPNDAFVSSEVRATLELLADRVDVLGFVTGRAANDAVAMVGVGRAVYV